MDAPKPKDRRAMTDKQETKKPFVPSEHMTDRPMKHHEGLKDLLRDLGGAPRDRRFVNRPKQK